MVLASVLAAVAYRRWASAPRPADRHPAYPDDAEPGRRRVAPLTRREREVLLHMIERVVRGWPNPALVAERAARHRGDTAGYPVLHRAARDLLAARDRPRARLSEELRPRRDAVG